MTGRESEIRLLRPEHAEQVGEMFLRELGRSFVGGLGQEFLRNVYFPFLLERFGDLQFVFVSGGQVAGFILGGKGESVHGALFRERFAALFAAAAKAVLRRPAYLFKILETFFSMTVEPRQHDTTGCGAVLFLAVDGSQQRSGVGTALIGAFEVALRGAGCRSCSVDTMQSAPAAQRFYERRGYQEIKRGWGRVWFRKTL